MLRKAAKYKWFLVLGDYIIIIVSYIIALILTEKIEPLRFKLGSVSKVNFSLLYLAFAFIQVLYFQFADLYKIKNILNTRIHIFLILKSTVFSVFGIILLNFLIKTSVESRLFYFILFITTLIFLYFFRFLFVVLVKRTTILSEKIIVIGGGKKGLAILIGFINKVKVKKAVGFIDDSIPTGNTIEGLPVLGKINEAHVIAKNTNVKTFVLAINNIDRKRFFEILNYFQKHNLTLAVSSKYLKVLYERISLDRYENHDVVRFGKVNQSFLLRFTKRIFDIAVSSVGVILLLPFFIIISIIIKSTSSGPVIYSQFRIGKNGKPFKFYKFRSMQVNSDKDVIRNEKVADFIKGNHDADGNTKIVNNHSVTKFGRFIRKTSIDELPQLFNVIKGDMSLVGPRPCIKKEWDVYEDWQKKRLDVLPGCTGIWQVSGRSKVNFEETVLMDLYYNYNVSLWLDIKILLMTIPVILFGKGGQ